WNPFRDMWNMMGQSSAAHGGSGRRFVVARPAQSGSAAVAALDALAAVNGQGAAAILGIGGGKRDPAFRRRVTLGRGKPATGAAHAMTAGGVSEVLAFDSAVTAFVATVKSNGIPATLSGPMGKLGVGSADLKRLRAGVLDQSMTSAAGPVLIAPLKDPGGAH